MQIRPQIRPKNKAKKPFVFPFIPVLTEAVSLIGVLFIYSASNYSAAATYGDGFYFVKKQLVGVALGSVAMWITSRVPFAWWKKTTWLISVVSFLTLALVFVPYIGVENYGAKRWIGVGGFTFQPSEIAKFALILFTATYMEKNPSASQTFKGVLPVLLFGGATCVLIILEPNMSITVCVGLLMLTILFAAGMKIKLFLLLLIPALFLAVGLIFLEPYRLNRLAAFLNPWASPKGEGYQLLQSLYALGSGGWFGVGLFHSRQKYAFLPFSESDFILSIIGEEIGFIGLIAFFLLLGAILFFGLKTASHAKTVFGYLLAVGITMIFGIQVAVNALVVSGAIPPTGLPLPLVSSGNTSIVIFMGEMGILQNISTSSLTK